MGKLSDSQVSLHQQDLFYKVRLLGIQVSSLASYLQNDFESLLADGLDHASLESVLIDMERDYDEAIKSLQELKIECKTVFDHYIDNGK